MSELPEWTLAPLREIGLVNPDPDNELHRELVEAVWRLGAGALHGRYITAMRAVFAWQLRDAGEGYAAAKARYEHLFARRKSELMVAEGFSGVKAEAVAEADDEVYQARLELLVAESKVSSMRKFLDLCESVTDVWRTSRADERAADSAHAQGFSGGA